MANQNRPVAGPVVEACVTIASVILSALLVRAAITGGEVGTTQGVRAQMLEELGRSLGVGGSIALSALLVGASAVWLFFGVRAYRRAQRGEGGGR